MTTSTTQRNVFLASGAVLFALMLVLSFQKISDSQDGSIRLVLGSVLALLIVLRPKRAEARVPTLRPAWGIALGVGGAALAMVGIVAPVHQFEWIGLLAIVYACFTWGLGPRYAVDLALALTLFYWVHPLPGPIFDPLQFKMQEWSVWGAEWGLHMLNFAAWGDGTVLHTGSDTFDVPASCSGMTTSVTVLLCTLGTVVLLRFRWWEALLFIALGLVQVLVLNIIRIVHMVWAATGMERAWAENFLHDTLTIYLVVALFVVQFEIGLWQMRRRRKAERAQGVEDGTLERSDKGTVLPGFWRVVVKWGGAALLVALIVGGIAFGVYKRRPYHHARMVARVVPAMMAKDMEKAEQAARLVLRLDPTDHAVKEQLVRILIARDRAADALELLAQLERDDWTPERQVLKAWAIYQSGDAARTLAYLDSLAPRVARSPGVAMIKAEIASGRDEPAAVATAVERAALASSLHPRIRRLFPYLAQNEQWLSVSSVDSARRYETFNQALAAAQSHLFANALTKAEQAADFALRTWPDEYRMLDIVAQLAEQAPAQRWQRAFADGLRRHLDKLNRDGLTAYLNKCFALRRADLAWLVYARLVREYPDDPAIYLAPVEHAAHWLRLDSAQLRGAEGLDDRATVDLDPMVRLGRGLPVLGPLWARVPRADLALAPGGEQRRALIAACREALDRVDSADASFRMRMMRSVLYMLEGDYAAGHRALDAVLEAFPDRGREVALQHVEMYRREGDWFRLYEAIQSYYALPHAPPSLAANLHLVETLVQLDSGAFALEAAQQTARLFPRSPAASIGVAAMWDVLGDPERALHVIRTRDLDYDPARHVALLRATGRFQPAADVAAAHGMPVAPPVAAAQPLALAPAEWTHELGLDDPPSPEAAARRAEALRTRAAHAGSPFFRNLMLRKAAWHAEAGRGPTGDPAAWRELGRTDAERGVALYELGLLAAQRGQAERASDCLAQASALLPRAEPVWRARVALAGGEVGMIAVAREACPDDPELWLAEIVRRALDGESDESLRKDLRALDPGTFPAAAFTRAGDFLLRRGQLGAAAAAAERAVAAADGLIAAYMLGLRCGVMNGDLAAATECAKRGARHAVDPWPFHMAIVQIKESTENLDAELINALERLRVRFGQDTRWAQTLGEVYFRKGDMTRSLTVLSPLVTASAGQLDVHALLIAAEAARLSGASREAVGILLQAYDLYPDNIAVVNNLVYNLAQQPSTAARARQIFDERLAGLVPQPHEVLDTGALVHLRVGDLDTARRYARLALEGFEEGQSAWAEARLNLAEIHLKAGELAEARRVADEVYERRDLTAYLHNRASALRRDIRVAERAAQDATPP